MSASLIGHGSQAPFTASLSSSPRGSRFFPWSASDRVRLPQALVGRDGEPRFGARLSTNLSCRQPATFHGRWILVWADCSGKGRTPPAFACFVAALLWWSKNWQLPQAQVVMGIPPYPEFIRIEAA